MRWEEKQINLILKKTKLFSKENQLILKEIVSEVHYRDQYVRYINKSNTISIVFWFVPEYDITIEFYPNILTVIKSIILNRKREPKILSFKTILNSNKSITNFEKFIEDSINHINSNKILYDKRIIYKLERDD